MDMRGNEQSGGKGLLLYGNGTVCGGESFDSTTADAICTDMGQVTNRVGYFRGKVSYFNQSEARKYCFLASNWMIFETLPRNTVLYDVI